MLYLASSPDGSNHACACKPELATFENTNSIFLVWRKVSPFFSPRRGLQCHSFNPLQHLPTSKPVTMSTEDLIPTNSWQERKQSQNKVSYAIYN
jgi:hypothetical protein